MRRAEAAGGAQKPKEKKLSTISDTRDAAMESNGTEQMKERERYEVRDPTMSIV